MTDTRDQAIHAQHDLQLLAHPGLWLCAVAAAFAMATTTARAADPESLDVPSQAQNLSPKQAYQHDRAFCNSSQATEARALCLKEASRAYHEARAGKLLRPDNEQAMGANRHQRQQMNRANASGTGTSSPDWRNDRSDRDDTMHNDVDHDNGMNRNDPNQQRPEQDNLQH
jgi:hypothetical protein